MDQQTKVAIAELGEMYALLDLIRSTSTRLATTLAATYLEQRDVESLSKIADLANVLIGNVWNHARDFG